MNKIKRIIKEELLKESYSGVKGYLQALSKMAGEKQSIYYNWLLDNLKEVEVVNHKKSKVLTHHVRELLRTTPSSMICQKKGCYETAFRTALNRDINIEYVEGYVQSIIPIVHAWNYYPDEKIYFDLTNDIAWKEEDSHFNEYYEVKRFSHYELMQWSNITGYAGGFLESPQFMREIIDTKGEMYGRDEWDYDDEEETLEEEGSMWGNDEKWGNDPNWSDDEKWGSDPHWKNDEKWGAEEGGSTTSDDDE